MRDRSDVRAGDGDEAVRLFVALELPEDVRAVLEAWQANVARSSGSLRARLRAIDRAALHVTLCFLGWRRSGEVGAIAEACTSCLRGLPAATLALTQGTWLPPRRPRVLAVELDDRDRRLGRVQDTLSQRLAEPGWYTPEARAFLAHVTVARVRKDARVRPSELPAPPPMTFVGANVTLYRSRLSSSGARYEGLRTVALASA